MCLYLTKLQSIPRIAKKDIVVYKYLAVGKSDVITPTRMMEIKSKLIIPEEKENLTLKDYFKIFLNKGVNGKFIHAFRRFSVPSPAWSYGLFKHTMYCVKCIIPKGTIYYKNDDEIASRKLEIIDSNFLSLCNFEKTLSVLE